MIDSPHLTPLSCAPRTQALRMPTSAAQALTLLLAVTVVLIPNRADAQVEVVIATGVGAGVIVLGGLTTLIGNAAYTGAGEQSPVGWRITGWMFGSFNVLTGAVPLTLGIVDENGTLLGVGIGSLLLAGAIFGVTGYATSLQPGESDSRPVVLFHPIALEDRQGQPAFGAGISIFNF
jgi:hypothetical protein